MCRLLTIIWLLCGRDAQAGLRVHKPSSHKGGFQPMNPSPVKPKKRKYTYKKEALYTCSAGQGNGAPQTVRLDGAHPCVSLTPVQDVYNDQPKCSSKAVDNQPNENTHVENRHAVVHMQRAGRWPCGGATPSRTRFFPLYISHNVAELLHVSQAVDPPCVVSRTERTHAESTFSCDWTTKSKQLSKHKYT